MAEFIVERSFLGVLGDLLIRQENRTMMILISQSPSLTPIIRYSIVIILRYPIVAEI